MSRVKTGVEHASPNGAERRGAAYPEVSAADHEFRV